MIRVLVVHEIRLLCDMISSSLTNEPDIKVIGCATGLEEAKMRGSHCDVIVVSSALPDNGALAIAQAFKSMPQVKVVVLGLPESEPAILSFIEAGAIGYVCRENSADELVETIRTVSLGQARISPTVAAALIARMAELADWVKQTNGALDTAKARANLTERECQVLTLVAQGHSNQEIAQQLTIELGTVKNHVHNILRKLSVSSREEAAACLSWIETERPDSEHARRATDRLPVRVAVPSPTASRNAAPEGGKQDIDNRRYNTWINIPTSLA